MPAKTQSVLLAGLAMGLAAAVVSLLPAVGGCIACFLYFGAGLMAVWHYANTHGVTISGREGAGMGALAGIIAGTVAGLISLVLMAADLQPTFREAMEQQMEASGMDPAQMEQLEAMFESPLFILAVVVIGLTIDAIVGAIGGAVGASTFKKGPVESGGASDVF